MVTSCFRRQKQTRAAEKPTASVGCALGHGLNCQLRPLHMVYLRLGHGSPIQIPSLNRPFGQEHRCHGLWLLTAPSYPVGDAE